MESVQLLCNMYPLCYTDFHPIMKVDHIVKLFVIVGRFTIIIIVITNQLLSSQAGTLSGAGTFVYTHVGPDLLARCSWMVILILSTYNVPSLDRCVAITWVYIYI